MHDLNLQIFPQITRFGNSILRYNTIEEFNVESKAECDQLNLAHEIKTNKRQCALSSVQVQYPRRQSGRKQDTIEERICETLEWRAEGE